MLSDKKEPILYVKFDGSSLPDYKRATASCVLYMKDEAPFLLRRERLTVQRSGEAEQMGFILALDSVISRLDSFPLSIKKIRFYGDSQVLFKHIRGSAQAKCQRTAFLSSIAKTGLDILESKHVETELYWVPRKCNLLADMLCRTAYSCCPNESYRLPIYLTGNQ